MARLGWGQVVGMTATSWYPQPFAAACRDCDTVLTSATVEGARILAEHHNAHNVGHNAGVVR